MQLSYLVLAHDKPLHFGRLAKTIVDGGNSLDVHIDSRVPLEAFRVGCPTNVNFVRDRIPVHWGGFSIVDATLRLMASAFERNPRADYFVLLSGDTFPLRSQSHIARFLSEGGGSEYMNILPLPAPEVDKSLRKLRGYNVEHDPRSSRLALPYKAYRLFGPQRNFAPSFEGMVPYCGSQWWALSRRATKYVLEEVRRRPEFVRFNRNTFVPDEHFFQTLLGNSPFREDIRPALMYADFDSPPPRPATITAAHLDKLREPSSRREVSSPYGLHRELLFGRKFPNDSADLTADISRTMWQELE